MDRARRVYFAVALMMATWNSHAQSCDCPPVQTCSACVGGLITLQLQYTGSTQVVLTISDNGGVLFAGPFVTSGQIISVTSSAGAGQPFAGNVVRVTGLPLGVINIDTSCGTSLTQGSVFGNIKIVSATVSGGQPLCCSTGSLETIAPVITNCPDNQTVNLPRDECAMSVTWIEPTASDNCTVASFTRSHNPNDLFSAGMHTVTYTATDIYGNQSTCSFEIIVRDRQNPEIDCLNGPVQAVADANCQAVVTWDPPLATDNCSVMLTSTHSPGDVFPLGTTKVTYTAIDPSGNSRSCNFNVLVKDQTVPIFTGCPGSPITVSTPAGCNAPVTWIEPVVIDNCSATVLSSFSPGDLFPIGTTTVTYTATDGAGNVGTCSFEVIVIDNAAPVITNCPTDITVSAAANCQAIATWSAPTSDACVQFQSDHAPGNVFDLGPTVVTYTATDASGNTATCSFTVTVADLTAPVISNCPTGIIAYADDACKTIVEWVAPSITDNCGWQVENSHESGSEFSVGETMVTISASDQTGNVSECTFKVTVIDRTPPTFTQCPVNIEVNAEETCGASVSWELPTVTDNCTVSVSSTHSPGSVFPIGKTMVRYTATDGSGNTSECLFEVVVNDTSSPIFTDCPADIVIELTNECGAVATWNAPSVSDNCQVSVTSSQASGSQFALGKTLVEYKATDESGNITVCSFYVQVIDNVAPVFTSCPSDMVLIATENCSAIASWNVPIANDACSVVISSSHQSGDAFPIGTTTIVYSAKDAAANISTCSFTVTVKDETSPVFKSCLADIVIEATDNCSATASWTAPVVDECNLVSVTSSHAPGTVFSFGTTKVTYTATDVAGNVSTCSFNVTLQDKTGPVFTSCPQKITVPANEACLAKVVWSPPVAIDNCGGVSLEASHIPGSLFQIGVTTITYKAIDEKGNWSTCSFEVDVQNTHLPQFKNCPADISIRADGTGVAIAEWESPTASIQCAEVEMFASHHSGESFGVGTTPVTYTANGTNGQSTTCTFNVTVEYEDFVFEVNQLVTPDGDGFNDQFTIGNIEKFKENKVAIVDRWGSVVFESSGYNNESVVWNGRNLQGVNVPAGTYFYTISVRFLSFVKEKRGFIELVR